MKRHSFVTLIPVLVLVLLSCNARMDKREKRYDEKECPFCTTKPGECSYCNGTAKCSFCNGTGKRTTSTMNYPEKGIERVEYEEECPFCKGTGHCRYCDGAGKCWACKGTGHIESWDFYRQSQQQDTTK